MKKPAFLICLLGFACCVPSCTKEIGPSTDLDCSSLDRTYSTGIRPIVVNKCAIPNCHQTGFQYGDFTSYNDLHQKYLDGSLKFRLFDVPTMPPASEPQLTQKELSQIKCWMEAGAPNN